ncbi:rRNA maturation RNase YbeY [Litorivicinus lipolyticus]|nr:rRNA maturation RNase YbeY [Litorivicinus lipolyticus]
MIVVVQSDGMDVCEHEIPEPDSIIAWANWASGELTDGASALAENTELCVQLLSETDMQALNQQYRGKDKSTNVLSFPFESMPGVELPILGDIALCPAVVAREAIEQTKTLHNHWAHMLVHGVLHLRGYDHIDDTDADHMEGLEQAILGRHGVGNPYES